MNRKHYTQSKCGKTMTKLLMTLAFLAVATTMSAQVSIGGEVGLGTSHTKQTGSSDNTFFIRPEVEYGFNKKFSVGLALGYEYEGKTGGEHVNTWSIQPFVRRTFLEVGAFSAFVDGALDFSTSHTRQYKKNTNSIGAFIRPGICYSLTKHISLEAHLGDGLYYSHVWNAGFEGETNADGSAKYLPQDKLNTNKFGFKLLSEICFGVSYDF